jgi:hypothetical protein
MLGLFGVTDEGRVESLVTLARDARDAKSWAEYDDIISSAFKEMIGQESAATSIWKYEPAVVPGYFQTGEYSRHLLTAVGHGPEEVSRRAEIRSKRQLILDLEQRPELNVIIGEAAFRRTVGDSAIMREQIKQLIEYSKRPGISLYMLPFSAGPHRGMGRAFTVLQFAGDDLDDSLYLEDAEKRSTSREDPQEVANYLQLFTDLEEMAERTGTLEEHATRILHELYGVPANT